MTNLQVIFRVWKRKSNWRTKIRAKAFIVRRKSEKKCVGAHARQKNFGVDVRFVVEEK